MTSIATTALAKLGNEPGVCIFHQCQLACGEMHFVGVCNVDEFIEQYGYCFHQCPDILPDLSDGDQFIGIVHSDGQMHSHGNHPAVYLKWLGRAKARAVA